jgi:hypothetical protein
LRVALQQVTDGARGVGVDDQEVTHTLEFKLRAISSQLKVGLKMPTRWSLSPWLWNWPAPSGL